MPTHLDPCRQRPPEGQVGQQLQTGSLSAYSIHHHARRHVHKQQSEKPVREHRPNIVSKMGNILVMPYTKGNVVRNYLSLQEHHGGRGEGATYIWSCYHKVITGGTTCSCHYRRGNMFVSLQEGQHVHYRRGNMFMSLQEGQHVHVITGGATCSCHYRRGSMFMLLQEGQHVRVIT